MSSTVSFRLSHTKAAGYPICSSWSSCLYSDTAIFSSFHRWTLSTTDIHPFSSCFSSFQPVSVATSPFWLNESTLYVCITLVARHPQLNMWNVIFLWLNFNCLELLIILFFIFFFFTYHQVFLNLPNKLQSFSHESHMTNQDASLLPSSTPLSIQLKTAQLWAVPDCVLKRGVSSLVVIEWTDFSPGNSGFQAWMF